ncbi:MAG: hypothetical protein AAFO07_15585, partial [Bacteroidota bacterium]
MNKQNLFLIVLAIFVNIAHVRGQVYINDSDVNKGVQSSDTKNSQELFVSHPNQYFVKLCHGVSQQETQALLAELNSVELWKNDEIGLRVWAVKSFPYTCDEGEII